MNKCQVIVKMNGGERSDWCEFAPTYIVDQTGTIGDENPEADPIRRFACPSHLHIVMRQLGGYEWVVTKIQED